MKHLTNLAKKAVMQGGGVFLTAVAFFFASVACVGHFHEPQVPQKLQDK